MRIHPQSMLTVRRFIRKPVALVALLLVGTLLFSACTGEMGVRALKAPRGLREARDPREARDLRELRDPRDLRELRGLREPRDHRGQKATPEGR